MTVPPAPPEPLAGALAEQVALARAATEARRGNLDAAERLLTGPDLPGEPSPARLDLTARLHAQRGRFTEADECWAAMLAAEPDNRAAAAARARLARIRDHPSRARPVLTPGRSAALVVAAVVVAAAGITWAVGGPARPESTTALSRPDPAAYAVVSGEEAARAGREAEAARLRAAVDAMANTLATPGTRITPRAGELEVVFEQGLFPASDRMSGQGAAKLAELGERLRGQRASVTVVGHAVAVPGGPSSGGSIVAMARALGAARVLSDHSGVPLTAFTLVTADQAASPFPDPVRNRTVTLVITPEA